MTAFGINICSAEFVLTTNDGTGNDGRSNGDNDDDLPIRCDDFQHTRAVSIVHEFNNCTEQADVGRFTLDTADLAPLEAKTYYFCLRIADTEDDWIHAGVGDLQTLDFVLKQRETLLPVTLQVFIKIREINNETFKRYALSRCSCAYREPFPGLIWVSWRSTRSS